MIPLPIAEVEAALGAHALPGGTITGICTDSREVRPGDCFIALRGRNVDARRFIPDVLARGAVLAISTPGGPAGERIVEVEDPVDALGRIALLVRSRFRGPVVGITGTAGKTTVKEFLRGLVTPVLRGVFPEASFNNREGVPRTIAGVEPDTQVLVLEIGTNAPGEIAALCRLARPTIGVLTAIGPGHLQGLRTVEGVLQEKLDLARALPPGGTVFVNGDDPLLAAAEYPPGIRVVRAGLEPGPGVVCPAPPEAEGVLRFSPGGQAIGHRLTSRVHVRNLWIALQVARELGVPEAVLAAAAPRLGPAKMRGEVRRVGRSEVLVDCYNANPLSMSEALRDLARRPGRRVAVLGEMLELGEETAHWHREIGRLLAALRLDHVLFVGPSAAVVRQAAIDSGFEAARIEGFADLEAARAAFTTLLAAGGAVLVKASRGVALERLLENVDA